MKVLLISLLLFGVSSLNAQDYGAEIQRILQDFSTLKSYAIEAKVQMSGDEEYAFTAKIESSPYGNHVQADFSEMIVNRNYAISIDHNEKIIRIDQGDFRERSKGKGDLGLEWVGDLVNENIKVDFLGSEGTYRTYVVHHTGELEKAIVKINAQTGFFHEIEVVYDSKDISFSAYKVTYTGFDKNPDYAKEDFSEKVVFTTDSKGKKRLANKYKDYRIIE